MSLCLQGGRRECSQHGDSQGNSPGWTEFKSVLKEKGGGRVIAGGQVKGVAGCGTREE